MWRALEAAALILDVSSFLAFSLPLFCPEGNGDAERLPGGSGQVISGPSVRVRAALAEGLLGGGEKANSCLRHSCQTASAGLAERAEGCKNPVREKV